MPRFYGKIGYADQVERHPGVWEDVIVTRHYYGDVIRNSRRLDNTENVHSNISVGNSISIVADAYAESHFFAMRFIEWMGALWTVNTVEVQSPRLILQLGGVYNGPTA